MPLLVGTSGWQYRDWRGEFYPAGSPVRSWLEHYAARFPAVENNGMFYRLARPATVAGWRDQTPAGFVMAVKASRYLTHIRRLQDPAEPVGRLLTAAGFLDDRLGPILLQLPPTMRAEPALLARCLSEFSGQHRALSGPGAAALRIGVEFRHPSWLTGQVRQILADSNAALVWSDRRGRPLGPLWRTADWGYLRLHEGAATPWPSYGRQALQSWLGRITSAFPADADVFAFFNNDQHGAAPRDAAALTALARRAGWPAP
jgi:uncharacterized protein YecE (DUF72 family)